jgi:hypothetical protein
MISFPCPCRAYRFEVPDSEAGGELQCPKCGRLVDIPQMSDLASLDADGTVRMSEATVQNRAGELKDFSTTYRRSRQDDSGQDIDLRSDLDRLRRVGSKDKPPAENEPLPLAAPHYDPDTGELIEAIDLAPTPTPTATPTPPASPAATHTPRARTSTAGGSTLRYQRAESQDHSHVGIWAIPGRLFEPIHITLTAILTVYILFVCAATMPLLGGLFFIAPVPLLGWTLLLAHYGCCIEDTGPGERNEIPRPLRNASFSNDIWHPLVRMVFSLATCFGPSVVAAANLDGLAQVAGAALLFTLGAMLFPAVAMTYCCSGTLANLRPDRFIGTIAQIGFSYFWTIFICTLAVVFGFGSGFVALGAFVILFTTQPGWAIGIWWIAAIVTAAIAVHLAHLATWTLGSQYRRIEAKLPWTFHEHERARAEAKRLKTQAAIEASRRLHRGNQV